MKVAKQNYLRERVYDMLGQRSKKEVLDHFLKENIGRSTIYSIFKRFESGKPTTGSKKTGRPKILNNTKLQKLKNAAKNKFGASNRKLGRKFGISKETVRQNLKKLGVNYHKRPTVPRYSPKQLKEIPPKCRILRRQYFKDGVEIILDDEKYFTYSWNNGEQNVGFYTDNIEETPDNIRFALKGKFEPKILVWAAISTKGVSKLYIQDSQMSAIKSDTYISKCLTKLDKFINTKHLRDEIIFWPDLASCHYSKNTQDWLAMKKINFVPKHVNPPNIPKARPVEDFWNLLCQEVYKDGWEANSNEQLKTRIKNCVKKVDMEVVQAMIRGIKSKLRKIEDNGPLVLYKLKK